MSQAGLTRSAQGQVVYAHICFHHDPQLGIELLHTLQVIANGGQFLGQPLKLSLPGLQSVLRFRQPALKQPGLREIFPQPHI